MSPTACLRVATVTAVGIPLKPNNLIEVNWEYEIHACMAALHAKGSFDHRLVCIDLTNYPVIRTRVVEEVPCPSNDRFDNDVYIVYSSLKENECALVITNCELPYAGLKRVTIVPPKK